MQSLSEQSLWLPKVLPGEHGLVALAHELFGLCLAPAQAFVEAWMTFIVCLRERSTSGCLELLQHDGKNATAGLELVAPWLMV